MKRTFTILASGIFLCSCATLPDVPGMAFTINQVNQQEELTENKPEAKTKLRLNEVNTKAARYLARTWPPAQRISWYKTGEGYLAYFYLDGYKRRSGYDLKGNWIYTIVSYPESKLDRKVRHMVKSTYYDFAIVLADEIQTGGKTIYVIHLEDESSCINIQVCDDEMEVIQQFKKLKT